MFSRWKSALLFIPVIPALLYYPLTQRLRGSFKNDHFLPHPSFPIEGYYTRITALNGDTILAIFSTVRNKIASKPHFVHFSYIPTDSNKGRIVADVYPDTIEPKVFVDPEEGFTLTGIEKVGSPQERVVGRYTIGENEQSYNIRVPSTTGEDLIVNINLSNPTRWSHSNSRGTPEGIFSSLGYLLPIHWHVLSTRSHATFSIERPNQPAIFGSGWAHIEKNWGVSFPSAWIWIQGFQLPKQLDKPPTASIALAGGSILNQKAYLLGYRNDADGINWDFRPLFTLMPFGFRTPFISEYVDGREGIFRLEARTFTRKIVLEAKGPKDHERYLPLSCPLGSGHDNTFAYESFEATIRVRAYEKEGWFGKWRVRSEVEFSGGALEFGGGYSFKAVQ